MILIFSLHYFLWHGALTSIFGYESVYARHYTNATPMQYGYLNMVLPFLTVIVTPVICSLADRRRSHRSYFTFSLVLTTIALSLYALLPLIMNVDRASKQRRPIGSLLVGPWIYYCLTSLLCDLATGVNTCLSDSFAVLQAEEHGTNFGHIIVWGTFGLASSASFLSFINQWDMLPRLLPGILFGTVLLSIDVLLVTFWPHHSDFKLDNIPKSAALTLTGSSSSARKDPSDYIPLNESARINLGSELDEKVGSLRRRTKSPVDILAEDKTEKVVPTMGGMPSNMGNASSNIISAIKTINSELDGAEQQLDKGVTGGQSERPSGRGGKNAPPGQPVVDLGPYEMGSKSGASLETLINVNTQKDNLANENPIKRETGTSFRIQLVILGLILRRRRSLFRFLSLFILSGFFMSMHWNYFFLYLEEIYYPKFELISALSMVTQSILGELPFFILSRKFIDFFGRSYTLSISVISIGIRFLLYGYFLPNVNMYYIVVADAFQGPNYGLFYVVMTEVGLEYSFCDDDTVDRLVAMGELDRNNRRQVDSVRLALRSTVQSVAFACYEGIGVGFGSLVGGWIVASYGFKTLWLTMAVGSISVGLINAIIEYTCREPDPEEERSERREFMEAYRKGMLTKVASRPIPPAKDSSLGPIRYLQRPEAKVQMLVRKSAGKNVGPPVATVSLKKFKR